jgi:hypothetical protein
LGLLGPGESEKLGSHKPIEKTGQTILALGGRRETESVPRGHEKHGLGEGLGRNVVRLVDYEGPEGLEGSRGKGPLTQSLNHGDDKVVIDTELILLNTSYGGTRTELLNALNPLFSKKSLVNYNKRATLEFSCERQCADGFPHSTFERKNAIPSFYSLLDSFDLMSSKAPSKINIGRESFGPLGWICSVLVKPGNTNRSLL